MEETTGTVLYVGEGHTHTHTLTYSWWFLPYFLLKHVFATTWYIINKSLWDGVNKMYINQYKLISIMVYYKMFRKLSNKYNRPYLFSVRIGETQRSGLHSLTALTATG